MSLGKMSITTTSTDLSKVIMTFSNGQSCYNGPKRNAKVNLICGGETRLLNVEEATICSYEFLMETPAVCDENYRIKNNISDAELEEVESMMVKEKKRWFFS